MELIPMVDTIAAYRTTKDADVSENPSAESMLLASRADTTAELNGHPDATIAVPMEGTIATNQADMPLADDPIDDESDAAMDSSPEIHLSDSMKELELEPVAADVQMQESAGSRLVSTACFTNRSLAELSRYSWGTRRQNYLNGCVWSPDGTCLLTSVNGDGMHIVELPRDLYATASDSLSGCDRPLDILQSAVVVRNGGTVYDYCWYPFMNSSAPATCCWLSTGQHGPIQMWDAFDGALRCTYRGYDAVDEVEAALCVAFSNDAAEVIGGYRKSLKIFRTDVPGRDFVNIPLKSTASCLATNSVDRTAIAIGSWNCSVTLLDMRTAEPMQKLGQHTGGVTGIKWLQNVNYLLTGARKDSKLICWDLRRSNGPLFQMCRNVCTNQTIYFDVSPGERWLASGDTDGSAHVWDLQQAQSVGKLCEMKFKLHHDCCNGVSFHPYQPILATSSGQHHFDVANSQLAAIKENSLIFWWYGPTANEKVHLKTLHSLIKVPHLQLAHSIEAIDNDPDEIEAHTMQWQEKRLSRSEIERYADPDMCKTDVQKEYLLKIREHNLTGSAKKPDKIFTYITDDCWRSHENDSVGDNVRNNSKMVDAEVMYVMADLQEETTLFTIKWHSDGLLTVYPDFNELDQEPYLIEIDTDSRHIYQYAIEIVSEPELKVGGTDAAANGELNIMSKRTT